MSLQIPEHLVEQMAPLVDFWDNISEDAQQAILKNEEHSYLKMQGRRERLKRPSIDFPALEEEARSKGWRNSLEIARLLDCSWASVPGWCERANIDVVYLLPDGLDDQGISKAKRIGLFSEDIVLVIKAKDDFFSQSRIADDKANAEADRQYEQYQKEKAERKAQQDKDQDEYRARVQKERADREEARQGRLTASREQNLRKMKLNGARRDVRRLTRQTKLAEEQFNSTASPEARDTFWGTRKGKQNFEYASTNYRIGRAWARGVKERYQENLTAAIVLRDNLEQSYKDDYGDEVKI